MKNNENQFIKKCFDELQVHHPEKFLINEYDHIPDDMISEDGKRWKLIESTVSEEDINEIENKFSIKLPNIYREYLTSYCHMFDDLEGVLDNFCGECDKEVVMHILPEPSDNPLSKFEELLNDLSGLVEFGYIPIGDFFGWGPLCFDMFNDYKLVWLDHDEYYDCESREELEDLREVLFEDFKEFMECFFCGKKHDCKM